MQKQVSFPTSCLIQLANRLLGCRAQPAGKCGAAMASQQRGCAPAASSLPSLPRSLHAGHTSHQRCASFGGRTPIARVCAKAAACASCTGGGGGGGGGTLGALPARQVPLALAGPPLRRRRAGVLPCDRAPARRSPPKRSPEPRPPPQEPRLGQPRERHDIRGLPQRSEVMLSRRRITKEGAATRNI